MNYLNKYKYLEVNSEIIEYDIKSANVSLCKEYNLLDEKTISKIEDMNKKQRVIKIGLIGRKNKDFMKSLEKHFTETTNKFIELNELNIEDDVISIKKDAVFVLNKNIKYDTIGNHIHFVKKNTYHAYLYLKPFEFYFKKDNSIDVKGLSNNSYLHKDGLLDILTQLIDLCENTSCNVKEINNFMKEFVILYKEKKLPLNAYREFNQNSQFKSKIYDENVYLDNINEEMLINGDIDISYNYINIILPLYRLIC